MIVVSRKEVELRSKVSKGSVLEDPAPAVLELEAARLTADLERMLAASPPLRV